MATIHFYEKPGCVGNARQKKLLSEAGHVLIVHDLLQQPWTSNREKLRSFFGNMLVPDWFNPSAPAIKNGEIDTEILSAQQAIALMVANPLLIRRPLLEIGDWRQAGFNVAQLSELFGATITSVLADDEACSQPQDNPVCKP